MRFLALGKLLILLLTDIFVVEVAVGDVVVGELVY